MHDDYSSDCQGVSVQGVSVQGGVLCLGGLCPGGLPSDVISASVYIYNSQTKTI